MKVRRTSWLDGGASADHVAVVHLTYQEVQRLTEALEYQSIMLLSDAFRPLISELDELLLEVDGK